MKRRSMIAVIGDANIEEESEKFKLAERLGYALVSKGYRVLCGGLGGIMKAVSHGARKSPEYKDGDIIGILPGYDPEEANESVDIIIATGLDHARNIIIANNDAIIAIGGGSGTLSELAIAWALNRLIIAYKVDGWSGKIADQRIDSRIRYPNIPEDRVYGVSSEEEVLELLKMLPKYNKRHKEIRRRDIDRVENEFSITG
ncbi:MAG: TIGR00725 family protein [Candidatus Methanoperedenaceae archaeon]|nr:TIGR00725 family protein [Candidatus Methanoperedenaceae archaeon]